MITVKCHYDNGETTRTRFNGSIEDAKRYFVGTAFDLSARMDEEDFHICVKVEAE